MTLYGMNPRWTTLRRSPAFVLLIAVFVISLGTITTPFFPSTDRPLLSLDLNAIIVKSIPDWIWPPLGTHTLTSTGLLVVSPDGPHPIFQLIRDAEAAWEAKCARASTSLNQAVAEYKRRYRRAPPLGFDKWWEYIVNHNVQLPDEYDEIFEDIEPFWGIDHEEMARSQKVLEDKYAILTFEKTDESPRLEVAHSSLTPTQNNLLDRIDDLIGLLSDVEQDLIPVRFSLSPLDEPEVLSDWRIKNMALEAAANGTTLSREDLPVPRANGWTYACAPDSPARLNPLGSITPTGPPYLPPSSPKTFIVSHRDAMNPCLHPWLFRTHGQFLLIPNGPAQQTTLVPRFSLSPSMVHGEIRLPVVYGWDFNRHENENGAYEEDLPWDSKVEGRLNWRGSTTGMHASPDSFWRHSHRQRLVKLTNAHKGNVSVLDTSESGEGLVPVGDASTMLLDQVNTAWMDIAFSGKPFKCEQESTCKEMAEMFEFQDKQEMNKEGRYKFILDIDGNAWSGRFKRLMTSNALVFKATIYPEWFTSRIAPWVHYVPFQFSYIDVYDEVAFFRAHDELAEKIAKAGRDWSHRFWRKEDMTAYLYRYVTGSALTNGGNSSDYGLLLEFGRVSSVDRASMDYVG